MLINVIFYIQWGLILFKFFGCLKKFKTDARILVLKFSEIFFYHLNYLYFDNRWYFQYSLRFVTFYNRVMILGVFKTPKTNVVV